MGTEYFPRLGAHCDDPTCGTLDFLPFTCDACKQTFCLEHRVYTAHQCPLGGRKDLTITICPDCSLSVRTEWGKDVNQTLETHRRTSCDPSKLVNASRKMKCPVRACRESLTVSNRVRCRACQQDVCLKHRFGAAHNCGAHHSAHCKEDESRSSMSSKFLEGLKIRMGGACGTAAVAPDAGKRVKELMGRNTSVEAH